ncbi:unnamed protein product [Spirodela intermedia]|uniref:Uncharacterized protein n=1 Tax=Spirodela intermedia TaxID=51605 RepID=A0A7I8JE42_SPIIN|nr:unnamed protein product [Spirodela intermedia]CAA6668281.1 unnamed protein product [Spirodela intermedia]
MPAAKFGLVPWVKKTIVEPLVQIIRRGAEPKQLAFSTALGLTLGLFPICGVTVFLCGMAIALLGNHCHAPVLVIPFLRLGEFISGGSHFPLTADAMKRILTFRASREVLVGVFHALLGWLVASPFILAALYVVFVPCFKLLVHKFSGGGPPSSPKKQANPQAETKVKARQV